MFIRKKSKERSNSHRLIGRYLASGGFSLVELLVSSIIATSVLGLASSIVFSNRNLYLKDASRTQVNQNIRGTLDIIGSDIRQAGERLPDDFPAVVVDNGTLADPNSPDTLFVYRSLSDVVLSICADISSSNSNPVSIAVVPSIPTTSAECLPDPLKDAQITEWDTFLSENPNIVNAYIYDQTNTVGEFFLLDSIDAGNYQIIRAGGSGNWTRNYSAGNDVRVYLLEERQFFLSNLDPDPANCLNPGEFLTLVINNDCANQRFGLSGDMEDFQVQVCQQTTALCNPSLSFADSAAEVTGWSDISSVDVSVTSSIDFAAGRATQRTVDSRFFPRNVLSF